MWCTLWNKFYSNWGRLHPLRKLKNTPDIVRSTTIHKIYFDIYADSAINYIVYLVFQIYMTTPLGTLRKSQVSTSLLCITSNIL